MGNPNSIRARRRRFNKFKRDLIAFDKIPGAREWSIREANKLAEREDERILGLMIAEAQKAGLEKV